MGKRKRRADQNRNPTSDLMPHSSQIDALPEQKSSDKVDSGTIASIIESTDNSVNLPQSSQLPVQQHHFSRAMLLRNPRYCSRKYSRRNSGNHADASTSHGKANPLHDDKLVLKLVSRGHSDDSRQHTDIVDEAFRKPERIRSNSFLTSAVSHDLGKMVCGICERLLRKKVLNLGNSMSSSEPSVVAVLVCGHLYHADCLEQKTCQDERMDPSCPLCMNLISQVDALVGQK